MKDNVTCVKEKKLKDNLSLIMAGSIIGSIFFASTGVFGIPFVGFVKELGTSDFLLSLLMAIPTISVFFQILVSVLIEKTRKRKVIFIVGAFLQRSTWILIGFIPFITSNKSLCIISILLCVFVSTLGGASTEVSFYSWMAQLIPKRIRGRFFGKINRYNNLLLIPTFALTGYLLDTYSGLYKFSILFTIAGIIGLVDLCMFIGVDEPPMIGEKENIHLLNLISQVFKNSNYLKYIFFGTVWRFSISMVSAFYYVYAINVLNIGFFKLTTFVNILGCLIGFFTVMFWGKLIDMYGNKLILKITCLLFAFIPFLWFLSTPNTWGIIIITYLISGIVGSSIDICINNLNIGLAPDKNRSMYIACFTLISTILGYGAGSIFGGSVLHYINLPVKNLNINMFGYNITHYQVLFLLAGFLQLFTATVILEKFDERSKKSVFEFFSMFKKKKVHFESLGGKITANE